MINQEKWGFDLTGFGSASTFERLLTKNGLKSGYKRVKRNVGDGDFYYEYTWSNKDVKLITGNNPLTGIYSSPRFRKPEKGYASYIGIEGDANAVRMLVRDIKGMAVYIKGESPRDREYIWVRT